MTITKRDIEKVLGNLDEDAKESFLAMTKEDQLLVILSMEGSNSNRLAIVERWQIDFQRDQNKYRQQREKREGSDEDVMSITQKMAKVFAQEIAKRFDFWAWARDRILPPIAIAFILGLLYLVFGGRLP